MKLSKFIVCLAAVIAAGGFCPRASWSKSEVVRLSMTSPYVDRHPTIRNVIKPWIEEVKRKTGGRLIITYFNPGTLCPEPEIYDSTVKGQVDIGLHHTARNPGKLHLINAVSMPMHFSTPSMGTAVSFDLYNEFPEVRAEFKDLHPLWFFATLPGHIFTVNKPVKTLEDIKGLKMMSQLPDNLTLLRGLGANPMKMGPTDFYLALKRNMADGCTFSITPARALKLEEAVKHITRVFLALSSHWVAMSNSKWDSLPADMQAALKETTWTAIARKCDKALEDADKEDSAYFMSKGVAIAALPPDELTRWRELTVPLFKRKWYDEGKRKGYSEELLDKVWKRTLELSAKYEPLLGQRP